jgi:hypothetical protein
MQYGGLYRVLSGLHSTGLVQYGHIILAVQRHCATKQFSGLLRNISVNVVLSDFYCKQLGFDDMRKRKQFSVVDTFPIQFDFHGSFLLFVFCERDLPGLYLNPVHFHFPFRR